MRSTRQRLDFDLPPTSCVLEYDLDDIPCKQGDGACHSLLDKSPSELWARADGGPIRVRATLNLTDPVDISGGDMFGSFNDIELKDKALSLRRMELDAAMNLCGIV